MPHHSIICYQTASQKGHDLLKSTLEVQVGTVLEIDPSERHKNTKAGVSHFRYIADRK
jgi:hypothetical protein